MPAAVEESGKITVKLLSGAPIHAAVDYFGTIVDGIYNRGVSSLRIQRGYNERSGEAVLSYEGQLPGSVIEYLRHEKQRSGRVACEGIIIGLPGGGKIQL